MDGSSIAPANFAVGSIFGIWPGRGLIGRSGREQIAAAYAVYGPRTIIVLARKDVEHGMCQRNQASLFLLTGLPCCSLLQPLAAHIGSSSAFYGLLACTILYQSFLMRQQLITQSLLGQGVASNAASTSFMDQFGKSL